MPFRVFVLLAAFLLAVPNIAVALPAFPGAEGFGANAIGGRGGEVYIVDSLADSGPGSLRECAEAAGPRTCVIRVAGYIDLVTAIDITNPYITIAGQSAPGHGVALRYASTAVSTAILIIQTHDVIVQHIRSRPGHPPNGGTGDAILVFGGPGHTAHDVIIDHVSASWADDENVSTDRAANVTIQWSILSEGLHPHSKCGLFTDDDPASLSFHHNLCAHNNDRNPEVNANGGLANLWNNFLYAPQSDYVELKNARGPFDANVIGNIFRRGNQATVAISIDNTGPHDPVLVYADGNVIPGNIALADPLYLVADPFDPEPVAETASAACLGIMRKAGAMYWRTDAADMRILQDVTRNIRRRVFDPSEVGGWPPLPPADPLVDSDSDGMTDSYEDWAGLDPLDPEDRNLDLDGDGYTELEEFLHLSASREINVDRNLLAGAAGC